jgi:hypothetical protein
MLEISIEDLRIRIGQRFSVSFQRTLRIPDDGREYPLPPGLGTFPIHRAADFPKTPAVWRESGDAFIPMYQREAMWLGFDAESWKPNAVQIGVGNINAVSGEAWAEGLSAKPQNYVVCPAQPWLDGINVGEGRVRQFVAMPLGSGYTVEAQIGGSKEVGGIRIAVYEPVPGRFPDEPPPTKRTMYQMAMSAPMAEMGLAAGGAMRQKIYPDSFGIETWDTKNRAAILVHIVDSASYRELTDREPPPTPIDAKTYTEYGFPWFDLYDEQRGTIEGGERFREVKPIGTLDAGRGVQDQEGATPVDLQPGQVKKLKPKE